MCKIYYIVSFVILWVYMESCILQQLWALVGCGPNVSNHCQESLAASKTCYQYICLLSQRFPGILSLLRWLRHCLKIC